MIKQLNSIAMSRIDYVANKNRNNEELCQQESTIDSIREKLKEKLSPDAISLLGDLEDAINMHSGTFELELYMQGVKDGCELNKMLTS